MGEEATRAMSKSRWQPPSQATNPHHTKSLNAPAAVNRKRAWSSVVRCSAAFTVSKPRGSESMQPTLVPSATTSENLGRREEGEVSNQWASLLCFILVIVGLLYRVAARLARYMRRSWPGVSVTTSNQGMPTLLSPSLLPAWTRATDSNKATREATRRSMCT